MSKPVNDVRSTSTDERYVGVVFDGLYASEQAKDAPDYGLPDRDIRAPRGMSRDRAALLGFLRLLPLSPLKQAHGAPFALISAELAADPYGLNADATADLKRDLERAGLPFVSVLGSYQGAQEHSFAVILPGIVAWHTVQALASRYDQQSVLLVNADRSAALHYMDGRIEALGTWQAVDSVDGLDSWTQDTSGQYYAVKSKHSKYSVEYARAQGFVKS